MLPDKIIQDIAASNTVINNQYVFAELPPPTFEDARIVFNRSVDNITLKISSKLQESPPLIQDGVVALRQFKQGEDIYNNYIHDMDLISDKIKKLLMMRLKGFPSQIFKYVIC